MPSCAAMSPLLWDKRAQLGCRVVTYGMENRECDLTACLHDDGTFDIINNSLPAASLPAGGRFRQSSVYRARTMCSMHWLQRRSACCSAKHPNRSQPASVL